MLCQHEIFKNVFLGSNVWRWMNLPVSRVPQCACWMTRSAPSGAEVCTFLFWKVHCGMPGRCAVGWVRLFHCYYCLTDLSKLSYGTYDIMIWFMLYLHVYVFMLYFCHVTVIWNAYLYGPKWSINYYYCGKRKVRHLFQTWDTVFTILHEKRNTDKSAFAYGHIEVDDKPFSETMMA